jgi:predicted CXXCH cytochrome family protein
MTGASARRFAWLAAAIGGWGAALVAAATPHGQRPPPLQPPPSSAVAASTCAECHPAMHRQWAGARHSKMLQPASPVSVLGDFSAGVVSLRGARFTLQRERDRFIVQGPFPGAREERHEVAYTLGSRRVQHYLTRLPDGRLVVLPPTWDVERREWFHNLDIVNPDESAANPVQVWNSSCYGCHVSGATKGFDATRAVYDTSWTDFGTSCERCHGPGQNHVQRYRLPAGSRAGGFAAIVVPTRLSPERSTMVCAQCHSLRDITVPGFTAGADYFDHFTPVLEYAQDASGDPAYWPDARPRRFSNDAIGLWQSRCYLQGGAVCTTCHADPHEPDIDRQPQLARTSNTVCASCHAAVVQAGAAHTRHADGSAGSACIGCHMPRTVVSLRTRMPDHTIGVPAPENTVRHGIPNACSECHRDRDPAWAARTLAEWYPGGRRQRLIARADAFAAARRRDPAALDGLIAIAADEEQAPIVRANAIGYLRYFPGPRAETYLSAALSGPHAPMRVTAALGLGQPGFAAARVAPVLINALSDRRRSVRVAAALSLVNLRVTELEGRAAALFEDARRDYLRRAELLADDARVLLDAGKLQLLTKDARAAASTLEASLRLDNGLHAARYFLALAYLAEGRAVDARTHLVKIPAGDVHGALAAQLLAGIK